MINQFVKFVVNGTVIAFLGWALQQLIYINIGNGSLFKYAIASTFTLIPLVCINFLIQRSWVFNQQGLLKRFLLTDLFIIGLVTALSPLCRELIDHLAGGPWGDKAGFITAALLAAIPSFFIRRQWVFNKKRPPR